MALVAVALVLLYVFLAFLVATAAERRGRSFTTWWLIAVAALPLAFLIIAVIPDPRRLRQP